MKPLIAMAICLFVAACGYYERPDPAIGAPPAKEVVLADDDDVRAAVLATARDIDMIVVEEITREDEIVFILRCRNDEPGSLTAKSTTDGIELTAIVGRFGDGASQRDLIKGVAARLRALGGRDSAPLRGYP